MEEIEYKSTYILNEAARRKASDIHLVPNRMDAYIYFRIHQSLQFFEKVSVKVCEKLISHFKFSAAMDIGEKRKPQNGSLEFIFESRPISLRLSTIPTPFQESLVIRLLPQDETLALEQLPLFPQDSLTLKQLIKKRSGLIIITGPTGSGKTTTLYSMMLAVKQSQPINIVTLEDPIEKRTEGLIQMEINDKAGITYDEGLKAILRHDPDIIMVGEIRDNVTAQLAVRSAMTGHLVLSTMHTNDTVGAIYRLLELGIPKHDIELTLAGVVTQRLVERKCPLCGESCSSFCDKINDHKITAVYEMLFGSNLVIAKYNIFHNQPFSNSFRTLQKQLVKAYALGFITHRSLERYGEISEMG
ncbi:competence type IV pilus ATPase ComGA [Alkalihalobacterium chitinilyticum]|uniref:Competence type IV pilus ATPase ComGA n=1 Tax=Alkalihalobacterium chitinilyticum TaxID=2980103 RepID=A0ABT5VFM6_9BACI|nr:competence type IV pilus ATPase ComGA [Alkalihalobacterium chitinilyticum]MDE5413971.1 competence type IV pilus ATPase ComGA [Alkalihalobacterium chitinilyticum]